MCDRGPRFDAAVPRDGYAWWYVDALSDDGAHALTVIAFIGSVFSPYYAAARRCGDGDPANHCAVNVVLYGPRGKYWALTERRKTALSQSTHRLGIGSSALSWDGDGLTIDIDELTVPRLARLNGRIKLRSDYITSCITALDGEGRHTWWPIAPSARVEIEMQRPALRWTGSGYFDCNAGSRPLERDFTAWTWSRAALSNGAGVLYDATRRDGSELSLAYRFDNKSGRADVFTAPPTVSLPPTGWRISRSTPSEDASQTRVIKTLEDTPFYARSLVATRLQGETVQAVHESLSLDRFERRWVQTLLPFRMPRALF
jgi:carotenoid 1,2-hydratase